MKVILDYLTDQYHPLAILLYGSFKDGTNDDFSDFDCMLIVEEKPCKHDSSVIGGIQLDCYLFTKEEFEQEDPNLFLTAYTFMLCEPIDTDW